MVARVTIAEIDPVRMSVDQAVELFEDSVVPALREQDGYEGVYVLLSPRGQGARAHVLERTRRQPTPGSPAAAASTRSRSRSSSPSTARRRAARRTTSWSPSRRRGQPTRETSMTKIFGIPAGGLAVALMILLLIALASLAVLALRNRVFFRLGVRNLRRRRGRTALIVDGPDARHGDHLRRARHGRHDEPHDPRHPP